ncbi:MAG: hypothetical protein PVJ87_09855 [Desulfobacterales bacterium]|jgi:hypothetical protein
MKKTIVLLTTLLALSWGWTNLRAAEAPHNDHGSEANLASKAMEKTSPGGTFEHAMIEKNFRAEFQIMSLASMNMNDPDGATHHVMVKLFHDSMNHPIKNAVGKVKIIKPDGKEQTNSLKNYNGIFAANFTFGEKGKYGVICLVIVDGEKHIFKFWYPHG